MMQPHPSGAELYDYFSAEPAERLSREDRERITLHVALCDDCAEIGRAIEKSDEIAANRAGQPPSAEEQADVEESLKRFRRITGRQP